MTENHPITPPEEVIDEWESEWHHHQGKDTYEMFMAKQAARWGADQELMACINWLYENGWGQAVDGLRDARRPKPPSLKEQSIALIDKIQGNKEMWDIRDLDVIRQALESLPD